MGEYLWECHVSLETSDTTKFINNDGKANESIAKMTISDDQPISFILENIKRLLFDSIDDVITRLQPNYVPLEFQGKEHENGCDECKDDPCCMRFDECMSREEKLNAYIKQFTDKIYNRLSLFLHSGTMHQLGIVIKDDKIAIRDQIGQRLHQDIHVNSIKIDDEYDANLLTIKFVSTIKEL